MRTKLSAGLWLVLAGVPAWAHHSFSAEFDEKKVVNLVGTVTLMEWVNPHTWIHVAVKSPDGAVTTWMIEGNTPNSLLRAGFTRKSLEPGTEIAVQGFQAKSGDNKASGSAIMFRDGRLLSLGSAREGSQKALLDWVSSDESVWRKVASEQARGESR